MRLFSTPAISSLRIQVGCSEVFVVRYTVCSLQLRGNSEMKQAQSSKGRACALRMSCERLTSRSSSQIHAADATITSHTRPRHHNIFPRKVTSFLVGFLHPKITFNCWSQNCCCDKEEASTTSMYIETFISPTQPPDRLDMRT